MKNKEKLQIQLSLLDEIKDKMRGHCIGSVGFIGVFTEHDLKIMKKEIEEQINKENENDGK